MRALKATDAGPAVCSATVRLEGDVTVVVVDGELDMAFGPELGAALATALERSPRIVADLTACTFIDGQGMAPLLTAQQACLDAGGALAAVGHPDGACAYVFALAAPFAPRLHPTRGEALDAVRRVSPAG